jgi:hypothetical protein
LPLSAQLNVDADALAGAYRQPVNLSSDPHPLLPSTGAQLVIQDKLITGRFPSRICEAASGPELMGYLRNRNHWTQREWNSIDLSTFKAVIAKHSSSCQCHKVYP